MTDSTESPQPSEEFAVSALAAAQAALAGEHACVFGYGVVGAHLRDTAQDNARKILDQHRANRDQLVQFIRSQNATPIAALAAYELPISVTDQRSAREFAAELERRLAPVYADLVASAEEPELRAIAVRGLVASAGWLARWSGETAAFPGLAGRPGSPTP